MRTFAMAKRRLKDIFSDHQFTLNCGCRYKKSVVDLESCGYEPQQKDPNKLKMTRRVEWDHVVPAESFGQSFKEWNTGTSNCVDEKYDKKLKQTVLKPFKGRLCAETNELFSRMAGDLYNLWPEVGELNRLRSNYSVTEFGPVMLNQFGKCEAKISNRKFEPAPAAKGIVARTYLYMEQTYPGHGIIPRNKPKWNLYKTWSTMYPVTVWECVRAYRIEQIQKSENLVLKPLCKEKGWYRARIL